jgi:hypothetical protein
LLLQFWPQQPHYKLVVGSKTLNAGETFEASEQDAADLLASPDIRKVPTSIKEPETADNADSKTDITQSPKRAQRQTQTTT